MFSCTKTLSSPVIVGVEVFGPAGGAALNDASAASVSIAAGGMAVFATSGSGAFSPDSVLGPGIVQEVLRARARDDELQSEPADSLQRFPDRALE